MCAHSKLIVFLDEICTLYYAHVTRHFDPTTSHISNSLVTIDAQCFTLWYFSNEITSSIVDMTSSQFNSGYPPQMTVNGYYGVGNENAMTLLNQLNPWVEYDFGKVVQIQKIIAKAADSDSMIPNIIITVEARVGNASFPSGDFSASTILALYSDVVAHGQVVVLESSKPIWGRYVSLKRIDTNGDLLIMALVNILGKK